MSVGGLLILCLADLAAADLRMASQPKKGFELVNQGSTKWNLQNKGQDLHFRYMEPATFGYKGLENQKKRNYDNFLRSNIDNEQDNRNFDDEDGKDHLPFRTYEAEVDDTYWWHRSSRRRIEQPPMKVTVSRAINPGESMLVPLRWNNPHASEMEVNIWIFEHAGKHPVVVPIRKPSCSGEGYQDNVISFTVPKDFDTLGAKIPGFKGCNADSKPQCTLQIYSHSVESRTYAIGFPIVIPRRNTSSDAESGSSDDSSIQKASEDPWLKLSGLRDICLPATDPSATITSAVPRWARLVSDVYNHAYQNSDYSPYSGQQHESISKNLQASAINKMVASNRGELGKAILPKETYDRLRYLRGLENKIYKNYESLANKVINSLGSKMANTGTVGADSKVQQLATCFRCSEAGSTNTKRLQTNTYIPSFQLPDDLVPQAKNIVGTKYAKLISDSGLVQIYVASLNDLLPFFYKAQPLGIIYQPAAVKSTIGTMPDARNFKKRNGTNAIDGGRDAATLAKQKLASDLKCPTKCLDYKPHWQVSEALLQESDGGSTAALMTTAMVNAETEANSSSIDGGGWLLVRHVPAGATWHPATDKLDGTAVYGNPSQGSASPSAWSIKFDGDDFDQFLFATGDEAKWLIAAKDQVVGGFYSNAQRDIIKSSTSDQPYQARWYRRQWAREDPWISLTDHSVAVHYNEILYGGNKHGSRHAKILSAHSGANVFIRKAVKKNSTSQPSKRVCSVQGYCWTGCNMASKHGPVGPYSKGPDEWIDTATCIDTLHVSAGCDFEVATGTKGSGQKYKFTSSSCMSGSGKPGYDRVRSIRVFPKVVTSFEAVGGASSEYCDDGSISHSRSAGKADCESKCKAVANGNCHYISLWTTGDVNWCHLSTGCSKTAKAQNGSVQIYRKHEDGVPTVRKMGSAAKPICEVQGYCWSGCDLNRKHGPVGPYSNVSGTWIDTANCIDTLHVSEGCTYEVATSTKGAGQRFSFSHSSCMHAGMHGRDGPGYDRVRSIRVFTQVEDLARKQQEAEGPCIWRKFLNHYSHGWAGGVYTRFSSLQAAQLKCLWLKEECKAVTCRKDGKECTVRASQLLYPTRNGEISYVAGRGCKLDNTSVEEPLIKGALATNTSGECHPCVQFFGKEVVHPVTKPDVTPLANDIMGDHVPKDMGANNLKNNPDDQPHVGDIKMSLLETSRNPTSVRRRRRRSAFIQEHE